MLRAIEKAPCRTITVHCRFCGEPFTVRVVPGLPTFRAACDPCLALHRERIDREIAQERPEERRRFVELSRRPFDGDMIDFPVSPTFLGAYHDLGLTPRGSAVPAAAVAPIQRGDPPEYDERHIEGMERRLQQAWQQIRDLQDQVRELQGKKVSKQAPPKPEPKPTQRIGL